MAEWVAQGADLARAEGFPYSERDAGALSAAVVAHLLEGADLLNSAPGRGGSRKAAVLSRRGPVAEQVGAIRVSLADDICVHRNPDLGYCGKDLLEESAVAQNLNLCVEHMEEHVLLRIGGERQLGKLDSVGEPEVGTVCLICRQTSEKVHACEVCGGALHAQCIADHFAGVGVSETNPCAFLCHACVILRLNEVYLAAAVLERRPGMQVCVVEGHPELLDRRTRPYYRAFGEGAMRSRFVVCQEREVTPRPSPFGLRATPARQGPSSAVGARGGTPPGRAPPSPRAGRGESRGLVSELEGLTMGAKADAGSAALGAADGLTRADLETFVRDFLATHSRGGPGAQDPLSLALGTKSGSVGRVNPTGLKDGYKPGAAGAPNTKEAFRLANYLGMRAESKQQKATMVRLAGAERLDMVVRYRDCPEEEGLLATVMLGELEVKLNKSQKGIPEKLVVMRYLADLRKEWDAYRVCGSDVYARGHAEYGYFTAMAGLLVVRIHFLEVTALYLATEVGLEWGVVWRYLALFVDAAYYPVALEVCSQLDRRLYEILCAGEGREMRLTALAGESVQMLLLDRARELAGAVTAPAQKAVQRASAVASTGGEKGSKGACSLCRSTGHQYKTGNHGHPEHVAITTECPAILSDDRRCGKKHAFSGPLQTPCRGGLPLRRAKNTEANSA